MSVSKEEIKTLARLARLDFDDDRCAEFEGEFAEIIEFANTINSSVAGDTSGIREVGGADISLDELRSDSVKESLPAEKITSNVQSEDGYFQVKRVVK